MAAHGDGPSYSQRNRLPSGGRASASGRFANLGTFQQKHGDMEMQIHHIEKEAYTSVLRAFKAQSDAITWEKEGLITELRKELRVSDEEHRELLPRVNADDRIERIREWRKVNGIQPGMLSQTHHPHDPISSTTISASHKRQKVSQSILSLAAPSPTRHPYMQPSSSAFKRESFSGARGRKPKSSMQYPSTGFPGRSRLTGQTSSGALAVNGPAKTVNFDQLVGRKLRTRGAEDDKLYEAVIMDYNPAEIPSEDIRWEGDDLGVSFGASHGGPVQGFDKSTVHGEVASGRGQGVESSQSRKDFSTLQNANGKRSLDDIKILDTEVLVKEVEKVISAKSTDAAKIQKAKEVLKEHEQSLIDAIRRLEETSDGESGNI